MTALDLYANRSELLSDSAESCPLWAVSRPAGSKLHLDQLHALGTVAHYAVDELSVTGAPRLQPAEEISSDKLLVEPGDLLVSRLNPARGHVFRVEPSDTPAVASTEFAVVRPAASYDARFIRYALASELVRQHLDSHVRSATRSHARVEFPYVWSLALPCPRLEVQRRIADYLDSHTSHLDELVSKNSRLQDLLKERLRSAVMKLFEDADARVPLRYLLRQRPTYGILKPVALDDGVPVLRIVDVSSDGRASVGDAIRVSPAQSSEFSRTQLEAGDVVVSVVGTIGRAAVITADEAGANISRALARLVPTRVSPYWLAGWIRSPEFERLVDEVTAGTAQRVLNMEDLVEFPVPIYERHNRGVAELSALETRVWSAIAALEHQRQLLNERRQALITAAVTGELEV